MKVHLYGLSPIPAALPTWHMMLEDLNHPPVKRLGKALGLSPRTIYRYTQTGDAPRPVLLSVFWLTRWGQSVIHCEAVNNATMAVGYVDALRAEVRKLEGQVASLLALGDSGAANSPLLVPPRPSPRSGGAHG